MLIHSSSFTFPSRLLHQFVSNGFTNSNLVLAFAIDPDTEFTAENSLADCCFSHHAALSHLSPLHRSTSPWGEGRRPCSIPITHCPLERYLWGYRRGESSKNGSLSHHASWERERVRTGSSPKPLCIVGDKKEWSTLILSDRGRRGGKVKRWLVCWTRATHHAATRASRSPSEQPRTQGLVGW